MFRICYLLAYMAAASAADTGSCSQPQGEIAKTAECFEEDDASLLQARVQVAARFSPKMPAVPMPGGVGQMEDITSFNGNIVAIMLALVLVPTVVAVFVLLMMRREMVKGSMSTEHLSSNPAGAMIASGVLKGATGATPGPSEKHYPKGRPSEMQAVPVSVGSTLSAGSTASTRAVVPAAPSSGIVRQFGLKASDSATVAFHGSMDPWRQHQILDICLVDSSGGRKEIMRAFFNEHGEDCGVLIETTQSSPVAFVHTGLAVSERGATSRSSSTRERARMPLPFPPSSRRPAMQRSQAEETMVSQRTATIFGATSLWDTTALPIAIMSRDDENNRIVARRFNSGSADPDSSPPLFEVLLDQNGQPTTLRHTDGRIAAELVDDYSQAEHSCLLHVVAAEDLWLAIAGVIAARKLGIP